MPKFLTVDDAQGARGAFGLISEDGAPVEVTPSTTGGPGSGTVTGVTGSFPIVITGDPAVNPNVGTGANATGALVFDTIAQLAAFDAGPIPVGILATVQSNHSLWALTLDDTLLADGITVVNSAGFGVGRWQRFASIAVPQYERQANWFINSVAGDDEAAGTGGAPIKTKAELFRRWGYTWSPTFDGIDVTITYVTNEAAGGHDPGLFAPNFVNGATLLHTAALPAALFTGTLLALTPKNRAANQVLETTFTTTTGAPANGMFLVNHTRGESCAWVVDGGPTFRLTQPLAPYVVGTDATNPTEDDTWANGDSVSGFAFVTVNIAKLGGTSADFAAASAPQHIVSRLELIDPTSQLSALTVEGPANVACVETFIATRAPSVHSTWAFTTFRNCAIFPTVSGDSDVPSNWSFLGGVTGGFVLVEGAGALFDKDTFLAGGVQGANLQFGTAFIDAAQSVFPQGTSAVGGPLYGQGRLSVRGSLDYVAPATTSLPLTGGILIGGNADAYSFVTPGGVGTATSVALVAITAASLDAAAGVAGFGGLASVPSLGTIGTGAATP